MFLVIGMLSALLEAQKSGKGQVIDAAITDGSASVMSLFYSMTKTGQWDNQRQYNMLDGGAPYYDTYETADGKHISIGSIEPQFYAMLIEKANLDPEFFADQHNKKRWPAMKQKLREVFKTKTCAQWCEIMDGSDVCFAPVLDYLEAPYHPHNIARNTYITLNDLVQPAPAPKFSRSTPDLPEVPHEPGSDTEAVLAAHGYSSDDIAKLRSSGVLT